MASSPVLPFLAGAVLLAVAPERVRRVGFLLVPLVAAAQLSTLEVGDRFGLAAFGHDLVVLRVDRLSLAFGTVFVLIAFLGGVFGYQIMGGTERTAALFYAGGALGVTFAGDLLTLFVFWEIMAVASAFLVWARRTTSSARSGMRYVQVHLTGGAVLLGGILWHFTDTGSLAFDRLPVGGAGYLILAGFALNAAIPPLHAWLADAYPQGTVAGTVFLSAFTTKAAVYTLARGFPGYEPLLWLGVAMALYGVVYAVLENDIRRLLAYHIVSQVGYMVAAIGLGTAAAINGATAHAFAHILYKALLLMGAGAVLHATGRSKLTELGGLARAMPVVFALYMIGAFSISSVPLFSGFVSKELVLHAASLDGRDSVVYLLKLASVGTFLHTGLKLPYFTWFGPRREYGHLAPTPRSIYLAMALASGANIAIGVRPGILYGLLPHPVDYDPYTATHLAEVIQLLVFTGLAFWLLRAKLGGEPKITIDTDWAYRRPAAIAHGLFVTSLHRALAMLDDALVRAAGGVGRTVSDPHASLPGSRSIVGLERGQRAPTVLLGLVILLTVIVMLGVSLR